MSDIVKGKVFFLAVAEVSNEISSSANNSATQIVDAFTRFLMSSPYYLVPFVFAFFSGHVWSYIILSYFSKKERKVLHSFIGRSALGIVWFALIFFFIHLMMYTTLKIDFESFKTVILTTVVVSFALQALILGAITIICRKDN